MSLNAMDTNGNDSKPCCQQSVWYSGFGRWKPFAWGAAAGLILGGLMGVSYYLGRITSPVERGSLSDIGLRELGLSSLPKDRIPTELLRATASHGGTSMAVCTAQVDENAEGFFTLDYLTGDLKGWVYYPRMQAFGGLFATNVVQYLGPGGKNPEYLLVSGSALPAPSGSNVRAASSLLYVVDVKMGQFVAFTIPWNRALENAGAQQVNSFVAVGGDVIRPMIGPGVRKPPAVNPNAKVGNANDPNNAADPNNAVDPANPNPPPKNNPNVPNNNNNKKPPK